MSEEQKTETRIMSNRLLGDVVRFVLGLDEPGATYNPGTRDTLLSVARAEVAMDSFSKTQEIARARAVEQGREVQPEPAVASVKPSRAPSRKM